jgi:hypothetical protein
VAHPKEHIHDSEHGENLKSRIFTPSHNKDFKNEIKIEKISKWFETNS